MEDEDFSSASRKRAGDAASGLAREALDSYSLDELDARIGLLEAEIARVKAHRAGAASHRLAAEALFNSAFKSAAK